MSHRPALTAVAIAAALGLSACSSSGTESAGGLTVTDQGTHSSTSSSAGPVASPAAPSVGPSPSADASGAVSFAGVTVSAALQVGTAPTITSTSSAPAPGLLVQDLVVGDGATPTATSTVEVNYAGVLYADGTPFDSSYSSGAPASFPLNGVVPGFSQGIGGTDGVEPMKTGGRRLVIFPASLGYGDQARGPIPAGASLVFVIDLVSVS